MTQLLSPSDVAERLGLTKKAFRSFRRRQPSFPKAVVLTERVLRWDEQDVEDWIRKNREEPLSE